MTVWYSQFGNSILPRLPTGWKVLSRENLRTLGCGENHRGVSGYRAAWRSVRYREPVTQEPLAQDAFDYRLQPGAGHRGCHRLCRTIGYAMQIGWFI